MPTQLMQCLHTCNARAHAMLEPDAVQCLRSLRRGGVYMSVSYEEPVHRLQVCVRCVRLCEGVCVCVRLFMCLREYVYVCACTGVSDTQTQVCAGVSETQCGPQLVSQFVALVCCCL